MRLTLVDNLVLPDANDLDLLDVHPHLGLISLATVAQKAGHSVSIYDPKRRVRFGQLVYDSNLYERVAIDLLQQAPDAIGFTTLGCSMIFALNVAEQIKSREPELPILLGGPHATMLHREILESFPQFDVIVRYEAEETLPSVLLNLEQRDFETISGISWRGRRARGIRESPGLPLVENLDTLPIPSYDFYPVKDLGLDLLRIEAGRGCPFACTFCSTASFFQRKFRLKSPTRLVRELDILRQRYGFTEFKLDHDLFTVDRRKVLAFCEEVKGRGYQWRVSARVDCVDNELLERMAEAGCVGLYFGIETGSAKMQRVAQKRLKLDQVETKLDIVERLGIQTTVSFITGFPEEQQSDQDDTLDMLGRSFGRPAKSCIPQLHILTPEPGTPLFSELAQTLEYDGYRTSFNAWLLGEHDRHQVINHPDIFSTYYYYPAAMPRLHYTFAVDALDVLRRVGQIALSYALHYFEGRLSKLIAQLRNWAIRNERHNSVHMDLVIDFLADKFGAHHHLLSLFRYSFSANSAKQSAELMPAWSQKKVPFDLNRKYELGSRTFLFSNLHDCAKLVERIRKLPKDAEPLNESETGERGCCFLVAANGVVASYRIDPGVHVILSMFKTPHTCREVRATVADLADGAIIDDSFFENVVRIGALVPVEST